MGGSLWGRLIARLSTDANGNVTGLVGADGSIIIRPVASYTWATRPAAADNTGITIRIADIGGDTGSLWISNGVYWKPVGGHVVLAASALAASVSSTTAAETLATIVVPAYSMGTTGRLRIMTSWTFNNSVNNKTVSVKFGAAVPFSIAQTTNLSGRWLTELQNRNATNSQVCGTGSGNSSFGAVAGALATSTIDTTADVNLTLVGQKADAADTLALESYLVELLHS